MDYEFTEAKQLIKDFAYTQIEITKQANFGKNGVTKKICKEEEIATRNLLAAIMKRPPTIEEVNDTISE